MEQLLRKTRGIWARTRRWALPFARLAAALALGFAAAGCVWLQDLQVGLLPVIAASPGWGLPLGGAAAGVLLRLALAGEAGMTRLPSVAALTVMMAVAKHIPWGDKLAPRLAAVTLAQAVTLIFLRDWFLMALLGVETLAVWGISAAMMASGDHLRQKKTLSAGSASICLVVTAAVVISGLPGAYEGPWAPCMLGMALLAMAAGAAAGPAVGAAMGVTLGAMAALAYRTPWSAVGAMAAGVMASAAMNPLGRPIGALGFALGLGAVSVLGGTSPLTILPYPALLSACGLFALIPDRWWTGALRFLTEPEQSEGRTLAPAGEAGGKILQMADCLYQLSEVFLETESLEGEEDRMMEPLLQTVAAQACNGCARQKLCWDRQLEGTRQAFRDALAAPGERRVLWEEDFPLAFRARCPRMKQIMHVMAGAYGLYRAQHGSTERIDACRALVGKQLEGMTEVMKRLAAEVQLQRGGAGDRARLVRRALRQAGLDPRAVAVQQDAAGRWTVTMEVTSCGGRKLCRAVIAPLISQVLDRPMLPEPGACGGADSLCRLTFRQARVFRVESGAAQKAVGAVCGDALVHRAVERGGFLLALSDGMGTGPRAAREAQTTLRLLECFYEAGFAEEVIFHTVNQVMLMRSLREMYATVDLCLVDVTEGEARFIKIGAAPSYILRGEEVITVEAPTLPLGILENVEPATLSRALQDGDTVVLVSDGLDGGSGWIEQMLPSLAYLPPQELAEALLEASFQWVTGEDDRSVTAARVSCPERDEIAYFKRQRLQLWKAKVIS